MQNLTHLTKGTCYTKVVLGKHIFIPIDTNGLVLYMPFESKNGNIVYDESKHGINGTVYGAIEASGQAGNKCLIFDGIDDYVDCGIDNSLDMGNGDFSVCLWFATNNPGSGSKDFLMKGGYSSGGKSYTIASIGGYLSAIIDDDTVYKAVITSINYMDGNWHHTVLVRDGNNLRLYVDGNEDANSPIDITGYGSLDSIRPLRIGCGSDESIGGNPGNYITSKIDGVKIYNRNLSANEVKAIYDKEK